MRRRSLVWQIFGVLIALIITLSSLLYFLIAPWIDRHNYDIELKASRTILDNVFHIVDNISSGLDKEHDATYAQKKGELKAAVELAATVFDTTLQKASQRDLQAVDAKLLLEEGLRSIRFGVDGYLWALNYDGDFVSHPDDRMHGQSARKFSEDIRATVDKVITRARADRKGFLEYKWRRLNDPAPQTKLSYFQDLPEHQIIIGAGVYVDDVNEEIATRKAVEVAKLRRALRDTLIAKTGYVFIFDGDGTMLIHPNPNIEGADFSQRLDPATGMPLSVELKKAAEENVALHYLWDRPDDPGNYIYPKITWVRHFTLFDWYIAASVYVDELESGGAVVRQRMLAASFGMLSVVAVLAYAGVWYLVKPLRRLARAADLIQSGETEIPISVSRHDEIGLLSSALESMRARVAENVAELEDRVSERTKEIKRSHEALADAEARQRLILDAMPSAIVYVDRRSAVQFMNRTWRDWNGANSSRPLLRSLPSRVLGQVTHLLPRLRIGSVCRTEVSVRLANAGVRLVNAQIIPHMSRNRLLGALVVANDVTDERAVSERLHQAQKLSAVGQLAGGLAHDFCNLLSIILGNLAAAKDRFSKVDGLEGFIEPAERAGQRGTEIIDRLMAFSKRRPQSLQKTDVASVVDDVVLLLKRTFPANIKFSVSTHPNLLINADASQLESAIVNLAINSRDAMPKGGPLSISVEPCSVRFEELGYDEPLVPADYVKLSVTDQGSGLSSYAITRVFEPFFTTKKRGSGLGLSMVYGFVKQSKGYIRVISHPDSGTQITIMLPLAAPAATGGVQDVTHSKQWPGKVALVVDGSDETKLHLIDCLIKLDYSIIDAASASEAFRLLSAAERVDLVLSNVLVPGGSGSEVANVAAEKFPRSKILLMGNGSVGRLGNHDYPILKSPLAFRDLADALMEEKKF